MLGFVLMEFVLRFFARGYSTIRKYIVVGYVLVFLL